MTKVYINYPISRIRSYSDPNSAQIGKHKKANQRHIRITLSTLSIQLDNFSNGRYQFASGSDLNDMWLEIDLNDNQFEHEVLSFIQRQIGQRYVRLSPDRTQIQIA